MPQSLELWGGFRDSLFELVRVKFERFKEVGIGIGIGIGIGLGDPSSTPLMCFTKTNKKTNTVAQKR